MHILLIADGRSPHTIHWARGMTSIGLDFTVLSSRRLSGEHVRSLTQAVGADRIIQPVDPWNMARPRIQKTISKIAGRRMASADKPASPEQRVGPPQHPRLIDKIDLRASSMLTRQAKSLIEKSHVDAVHALRVQIEGIASARIDGIPIAVSLWGQDLSANSSMGGVFTAPTRAVMARTDLLFADCERDVELAPLWGLRAGVPRFQMPGNFGTDLSEFPNRDKATTDLLGFARQPLVLYPRGLRGFVNYQGFAEAAELEIAAGIRANFLGVGLSGVVAVPQQFSGEFKCTGVLSRREMLRLMAASDVIVSPAWSDGMPNSVLEGLAAGAIPVCGKIDSLEELERKGAVIVWCDASDSRSIAAGIRSALKMSEDPRNSARNKQVVRDFYSTDASRRLAVEAYSELYRLVGRADAARYLR